MQTINLQNDNWLNQAYVLLHEKHLIVLGEHDKLQWFATNLFQYLIQQGQCEAGYWFGKLINDLPDFCHQLCRSTPWSFEMGLNLNAVRDVLRGDGIANQPEKPNNYVVWFDASHLLSLDRKLFLSLYDIILDVSWEQIQHGINKRFVFLFPDTDETEVKRLLLSKPTMLVTLM